MVRPSSLRTFVLPGPGESPIRVGTADTSAVRLLIQTIATGDAFFAFETEELRQIASGGNTAGNFFWIQLGVQSIVVLSEKQALYAIGAVAGVIATVAQSEAFPLKR